MGLIAQWRLRRAMRRYARQLPADLAKSYGPSEFYTARQIEAAVRRQKLPPDLVWFGYAAFLPKPDFLLETRRLGSPYSYEAAREAFKSVQPSNPLSGGWENSSTPVSGIENG